MAWNKGYLYLYYIISWAATEIRYRGKKIRLTSFKMLFIEVSALVYEVEFSTRENGVFETVHIAMIHALSVTECQEIADDLASSISPSDKSLLVGIGELAE